jgi:hypothetical protein
MKLTLLLTEFYNFSARGNLKCLANSIYRPEDYRQMDAEKLQEKVNPKQRSKLVKNRQVW